MGCLAIGGRSLSLPTFSLARFTAGYFESDHVARRVSNFIGERPVEKMHRSGLEERGERQDVPSADAFVLSRRQPHQHPHGYFCRRSTCITFQTNHVSAPKRESNPATQRIGDVTADSSKSFAAVKVPVPGERGDKFYVEMQLQDSDENVLSENTYFLLVDGQMTAAKHES